jgi:hypothetical protein
MDAREENTKERIWLSRMEYFVLKEKITENECGWSSNLYRSVIYNIPMSKLRPPYNNLSGRCGIVQQVVKCTIYYNNLSGGCGLVQQVVKCSI